MIEDYHLVSSLELHRSVGFFLARRPPGVRVLVAGRAEPGFPVAALRARGGLKEIRAADLRFTPEEAGAFFRHVAGLPEDALGYIAASDAYHEAMRVVSRAAASLFGAGAPVLGMLETGRIRQTVARRERAEGSTAIEAAEPSAAHPTSVSSIPSTGSTSLKRLVARSDQA